MVSAACKKFAPNKSIDAKVRPNLASSDVAITEIRGRRSAASLPSRRHRWRWGGGRFVEIEFYFRRFVGAGLRSEEGPWFEAKHFVQHIRRKLLQRRVVLLHGRVKIISLDRNAVLGAFQLDLKAAESFRRPELGIILAHNKKPRQRGAELPLRLLEFFQLGRVRRRLARIEFHLADAR